MFAKLFIIGFVLLFSIGATAQREEIDAKYPRLNEGQMFSVKIVPRDRKLEIYVIGNEVAKLNVNDLTIEARGLIGKKSVAVDVMKSGNHFLIEAPAESKAKPFNLKLKVQHKNGEEDFEFRDVPGRP